jgi:HAD superfamily hydrolase (TIGR01509 family)
MSDHPNFQAIIFDMDGVIVDSEPLHEKAFMETFDDLGYAQTHGIHFADYLGRSDRAVWEAFIAKHQPSQTFDELTDLKESRLIGMLHERKPLFAPVPNLIRDLAARYPLALASGSVHRVISAVLEIGNLRHFFGPVVSAQDVAHGKPSPDIFLRAAHLLGVPPESCCVIEDTVAGITAGRAAGMHVIAITNTYPASALHQAHQIVESYDPIARFLLRD